jgi:[protein-PII] uridylyltransferase
VAVVAVGGYGRRMLLPGSDVDIMLLHDGGGPDAAADAAERLFYPFWDAGITLGHAVRTIDECLTEARTRVDVACSLLDARTVAGPGELAADLLERLVGELRADPNGFVDRLRADAAARHERFAPVSMALEPDLKDGSGGLRDVHLIGWAGRVGIDTALSDRDPAGLDAAEEFLVRVRSALHLEAGKRTDRLALDYQPSIAAAFGFEASAGLAAPDALMRTLFRHAREVEHVRDLALRSPGPYVDVDPPSSGDDVLEVFEHAARAGRALSPAVLGTLGAVELDPASPWTARGRAAFLGILSSGDDGARALAEMDRLDLLDRLLPGWEDVRCRPQRDPYHGFTVDVHLLRTAAGSARALRGEDGGDRVLRAASAAVEDPEALLLGSLFHDIGKTGEGRHAEVGERITASVLDRMGVDGSTAADVLFLVRHHLLLAETAVRRDLADENPVLDVAAAVGSPRRLAMLYVLTVADAEATGPHASSPWRLGLVRELVGKVHRVLESGPGTSRAADLGERVERIRALLDTEDRDSVRRYLERVPRSFLLAVPPDVVAAEFGMVGPPVGATEVRTRARPGRRPGTHDLTVVAADRPGLLARIAGSLSLSALNILSAQAFTTEDGVAIDVFTVEPAFRGDIDEERWRRFRGTLRRSLEGRLWLEERVRERRAHLPAPGADVLTAVRVLDDASDFFTVVEVETGDRVGLLHDLAHAFEDLGLDVHLAKVATYGPRVVDAFYVRDLEGRKVGETGRGPEVESLIVERLAAG